jgi:hypothetical protein
VAASKDHVLSQGKSEETTITAYAIALYDPNDEWDVLIARATTPPLQHPVTSAQLPEGYTLTGGGAFANYGGEGSLLVASYPGDSKTWRARSTDFDRADPAPLTAYVIGIKARNGAYLPPSIILSTTGAVAHHPTASVLLPQKYILVGGGAEVHWFWPTQSQPNLLTSTMPDGNGWTCSSKDQAYPNETSTAAYVIGVENQWG